MASASRDVALHVYEHNYGLYGVTQLCLYGQFRRFNVPMQSPSVTPCFITTHAQPSLLLIRFVAYAIYTYNAKVEIYPEMKLLLYKQALFSGTNTHRTLTHVA